MTIIATPPRARTHPSPVTPPLPRQLKALRPLLCATERIDVLSLSSPHYGHAPATIALSDSYRVGFSFAGTDQLLANNQLVALGCTAVQAWHRAVDNVAQRACEPATGNAEFKIRPAHVLLNQDVPGIQLHSAVAPTSAWLCHPLLFAGIHDFATRRLRCAEVSYFCPTSELLFAVPDAHVSRAQAAIEANWGDAPGMQAASRIRYQDGFPT